jgi:energy-coupling factor transport system ATP-binding protein
MIQFENFGFRHEDSSSEEDFALRGIDLTVDSGEVLLVLGRSGCGKSTMGLAVNGIVPHLVKGDVEGSLLVSGLQVLDTPLLEMSKHVGTVFQDPDVQLFALTVEDEVAMSLESFGIPRDEMRRRVDWATSVTGLEGLELNAPMKLSGGQKQRVAIAAVIAREPSVLVFDEPTGNLDPVGTRGVYEVIRRICEERETTVVLIEHDLAAVMDVVDKVVVLEAGRIIFRGAPRDLLCRTDLLRTVGAKVPIASELGLRLMRKGLVDYTEVPFTPEEAAAPLVGTLIDGKSPRGDSGPSQGNVASESDERSEPVVSFRSVSFRYPKGTLALNNVNLDVMGGDFLALVGMNGAGKTTLAQHVMGLLVPTEGEVVVGGQNTREQSVAELSRHVGLIFQNPNDQLFKESVESELRFGPENLGWEEERIQAAVERVLALVELTGMEQADPEGLSTGQKKRVAIASTLVMEPQLLLLDEPTTGQDLRTLNPILDLVSSLHRRGMTVLMITHDMEVVMQYATRVVVMSEARIIADGPPNRIFLQDEVLKEAHLHRPELLQMTAALNGGRAFWIDSLDALEAQVVDAAARPGPSS